MGYTAMSWGRKQFKDFLFNALVHGENSIL